MNSAATINDLSIGFEPVGSWLAVGLVTAVLAAVLVALGPDRSRLSRRGRLTLVLLRLGAFLAVVFCLLRPSVIATSRVRESATLLLLADASESMTVADGPTGQSRWEHLRESLAAAAPAARRAAAGDGLQIRTWLFDREVRELSTTAGEPLRLDAWQRLGSTEETAIGSALEDATRALAGQRLAGVVLLSDGGQHAYPPRDLPPQTAARRLGDEAVPLWAIPFGRTRGAAQARDAAMASLSVPETVFLGTSVEVAGRVRLDGLTDREATVRLSVEQPDGRLTEVARRTLRASAAATEEPVRLEWTPDSLGERKLVLAVDPVEGETVVTNNELSTFVEVVDGGLRVLYLEGSPRVEQRFLRRTLAASPDIQIDFRWIDSTRRQGWPVDLEPELSRDYKVFLIGDLDADAVKPGDLTALRARVEAGAGIGLLGGFHAFEAGGWGSSPLGRLLPYEKDPLARQRFGEPIRADLHIKGPLTMRPDRRFGNISILRQADTPEESRAVWRSLPPLDGANRIRRLLPVAKPLAVADNGTPLLVAREYGLGRVLTFAADSTWRWVMEGSADAHRRFWRQLVLWLARRDDADGETLWLKLASRRVVVGSPLAFDTGVTRPDGSLAEGLDLAAVAIAPDGGSRRVRLSRQGESYVGTVTGCDEPGDWRLLVRSEPGGDEVSARFTVYRQDLELANPRANTLLLRQIAGVTDGGVRLPEELPEIFAELAEEPAEYTTTEQWSASLWDSWPLLAVLAGCLCGEWYLRKRWGLV